MQDLKTILEAMKSPEDLQKAQQLGSTTTDGALTTPLPRRDKPLTEGQLTAIASRTLQQPLTIISEERPTYGLKTLTDEYGAYAVEKQPIGSEKITDVVVDIRSDVPEEFIEAALRLSPVEAITKHLSHLALHKKLGSTTADRAVLLADYVDTLQAYPEFIVHVVCRFYWQTDRRPFIPYIGEMRDACQLAVETLQSFRERRKIKAYIQPTPPKTAPSKPSKPSKEFRSKETWDEEDWAEYIGEAEKMLDLAATTTLFNAGLWKSKVEHRTRERDKNLKGKTIEAETEGQNKEANAAARQAQTEPT